MYCKKCKVVVVIVDGEYKKTCTCEAPIIAEMKATVIQNSNLE